MFGLKKKIPYKGDVFKAAKSKEGNWDKRS